MSHHTHQPLGRTGFDAHRIGIGDVADRSLSLQECVATLRHALDAGLNVVDTAPNYEDGFSEEIVGEAVRERRESVFVIDKVDHLDEPVEPQVEGSLARLKLDAVDAFVFHAVSSMERFDALMKIGGGFDQLADCVSRGRARFRGISSHHPDVLRAALEADVCDLVMFPLGPFVDPRYVDEILPMAQARGVATVCFKTFGAGKLVADTTGYNQPLEGVAGLPRLSVSECVHYTLTLNPDVTLLGMSTIGEQNAALAAFESFTPLDAHTMTDIRLRAAEARRGKGPCWWNPDPEA